MILAQAKISQVGPKHEQSSCHRGLENKNAIHRLEENIFKTVSPQVFMSRRCKRTLSSHPIFLNGQKT